MPEKKKMGRPIVGEPKDEIVQLRLDKTTLEKLNRLSEKKKISKSQVMRELIKKAK